MGKDNYKSGREIFQFGDLLRLILEINAILTWIRKSEMKMGEISFAYFTVTYFSKEYNPRLA